MVMPFAMVMAAAVAMEACQELSDVMAEVKEELAKMDK